MKSLIIASTSTLHKSTFLAYLQDNLEVLFENVKNILFIPYARPGGISYENYTETAKVAFKKINKTITGIQDFSDPVEAVSHAQGIFIGGGNTFVLVKALYNKNLIATIKNKVTNGTPYLGSSAGSNICGLTMQTTNDMPIVYPPSFETLGLVPFNINPHYLDANPNSTHMGETRATRIKEFHAFNSQPVVGLREGSWLEVKGKNIRLRGQLSARIFEQNKPPYELDTGKHLNFMT